MKLATICSTASLCLSLLCGVSAFAQAQPAPEQQQQPALRQHHHHSPEHETRRLTRELNLSPNQAARIEPILAARHQQMHALRESGNVNREQRRAIARSTHEQMNAVLTEGQRQQLHAIHARHHQHRQGRASAPAV